MNELKIAGLGAALGLSIFLIILLWDTIIQLRMRREKIEPKRLWRTMLTRMLTAGMLLAAGFDARSQTNQPPPIIPAGPINLNFLTNIVTASNFQAATFGINAGVLMRNGTLENELKADWYLKTNWMFSAAIQNAPTASIVDNATLFGGYRKAWQSSDLYGQLLVRRTWGQNAGDRSGWQGGAGLGASWLPMDGGHVSVGTEARLLTSPVGPTLNTRPSGEIVVFTTLKF